jgi:hypothetical protein
MLKNNAHEITIRIDFAQIEPAPIWRRIIFKTIENGGKYSKIFQAIISYKINSYLCFKHLRKIPKVAYKQRVGGSTSSASTKWHQNKEF